MCCTRLATNAGPKKVAKNRHLGTMPQICRAISLQLRHVSIIRKKNLLSSNTSSTCPDNVMNFGPLMAEIGSGVWDTPANFNGFCVLAALLHSSGLQIGLFDVISDVNKEIVACKGSCWSLMMSVLPSLVSDI